MIELMQQNRPGYVYIPANGQHTHTLIFLHGLGDSAQGFEDVFDWREEGCPMSFQGLKVVLPTAPKRPVTLNMGYQMNSWFDIFQENPNKLQACLEFIKQGKKGKALALIFSEYDQTQVKESIEVLYELVGEEAALLNGQT